MRSLLCIFLIGTLGANSSACGLLGKSEVNAIVKIGAPAAVLDSQVDVDRVANLVPQDESIANSVSSVSLTVAGSCITSAVAVSIIVESANIDITVPCDASSGMFEIALNLLDAPDGKTSIRIRFLNSLVSTASMYEIERVVIKDTEGLESFSIPETFTESAGYIRVTEVSGTAIYRVTFTPRDSLDGTPTTIESTSTNIPVSALTIGTSYTVSVDALDDKQNVTSASNTGIFVNGSIGPPGAFSISSATNGNTQSVVTWGAASGATSYTVKYGTSSGSYGTTVSTGATSPTTITGLSNGTTYYIMVTAVNASGSTNASAQVTATPAPSISAVVPPQNMGVLYGYNQSLPKYDVRVYWDSSSNPKFADYEVAYRVSGANWITETLRAKHYTYLDYPIPPIYSFDSLSNGMLYKKQLDPGTNYEFRVRSWYYSEDQPTVVDISSDWATVSVNLPSSPGTLTTAARLKVTSITYNEQSQWLSSPFNLNLLPNTTRLFLKYLRVKDRFFRSEVFKYRVQGELSFSNFAFFTTCGDYTCVDIPNLKPSTTYEIYIQTWFYNTTEFSYSDGGSYYTNNETVPDWVTTTVTQPSFTSGEAPRNLSVNRSDATCYSEGAYQCKKTNLSWDPPRQMTNSYGPVIGYSIQSSTSGAAGYDSAKYYCNSTGSCSAYPTRISWETPSFELFMGYSDASTFRVRAVYALYNPYGSGIVAGFSPWVYVGVSPTPTPTAVSGSCSYQLCGNTGNGCYDNITAKNDGFACLADGTQIDYVFTTRSFSVWKEHNGSRILHASGLWSSSADWQKTLNRNGNGFTTTNFTTLTNIAGRACPPNSTLPSVHISDDNNASKFATGYCLYYDNGGLGDGMWPSGPTRVNAIPYQDYLGYPSALVRAAGSGGGVNPSWYEGNSKTCADKGMRLPAVFETNTTATTSTYFPTGDGTPSFAGIYGVRAVSGCGQTATAYFSDVWMDWYNDSSLVGWINNSGFGYIGNCSDDDSYRCVLP